MLEPDPTTRTTPAIAGAPGNEPGPHTLQILMTEHWSLLASRSFVYTEAMARTSIFVASLTGSVVALALVGQATEFGTGFVAFALVLLPVVFVLGMSTVARLAQVNWEDAVWVQGMNRIRNAYLEIAPELEPYFVTSKYDDDLGVIQSSIAMREWPAWTQAFVAVPGIVATIDSVVLGATAAIAAIGLDFGTAAVVAFGAVVFVLTLGGFVLWSRRQIAHGKRTLTSIFPSPPPANAD